MLRNGFLPQWRAAAEIFAQSVSDEEFAKLCAARATADGEKNTGLTADRKKCLYAQKKKKAAANTVCGSLVDLGRA